MGLFDWIKSGSSGSRAIALDIGTEFVKVLIFEVKDGIVKVIGVGRKRQRLTDMQGGTVTDIHGVIDNCGQALEEAAQMAGGLPDQTIIGIAGELVKGITTTIKFIRPNCESKINESELQEILTKVQDRALVRARENLKWETGHEQIDLRLVSSSLVRVTIDGYKVINPLGFQGKEVEVGIYSSFAPIVHLGALQTIAEELNLDLISVVAEPHAVSRVLGPSQSTEFSAIFIDIGGGTTDIAVVDSGGLLGTKMFAFGGRGFTKRIMNDLSLSFSQAEEYKIKYSAGKLPAKQHQTIAKVIKEDVAVWFSGVELVLEAFVGSELMPSKIYLCGGGSNLPDISHHLQTATWSKKIPFTQQPVISFIKPENIESVIDQTGKLTTVADITPMALANMAIDLVGQSSFRENIVSKLIGSLRS